MEPHAPMNLGSRRSVIAFTPSAKSAVPRRLFWFASSSPVAAATRSAYPSRMICRQATTPSGEHSAISVANFIAAGNTSSALETKTSAYPMA